MTLSKHLDYKSKGKTNINQQTNQPKKSQSFWNTVNLQEESILKTWKVHKAYIFSIKLLKYKSIEVKISISFHQDKEQSNKIQLSKK